MNKKRVLFPLFGVLVLSSAAAVTGTVAWFTANLTAKTVTDNITVVKTGAKLSTSLTAGFGTEIYQDTQIKHKQLIDGSVDLKTGNVYKANFDKSGQKVESFTAVSDGVDAKGATQFRASKFTITFKMEMVNELKGATYGLYLDPAALVPQETTTNNDSDKALRVGVKNGTEWVVWAPYDKTETSLNYVDDTSVKSDTSNKAYTASYDSTVKVVADDETVAVYNEKSKLYLGKFVRPLASPENPNFNVEINVDVYTWFEGAALINTSSLNASAVSYTLGFNAVKSSK